MQLLSYMGMAVGVSCDKVALKLHQTCVVEFECLSNCIAGYMFQMRPRAPKRSRRRVRSS